MSLKVTGPSEEHRGERISGDGLYLVTIETGKRRDSCCVGFDVDAQP